MNKLSIGDITLLARYDNDIYGQHARKYLKYLTRQTRQTGGGTGMELLANYVLVHSTPIENLDSITKSGRLYDYFDRQSLKLTPTIGEGNIRRKVGRVTDSTDDYNEANGVYFRLVPKGTTIKPIKSKARLVISTDLLKTIDNWYLHVCENNGFAMSRVNGKAVNAGYCGETLSPKLTHLTFTRDNINDLTHYDLEYIVNEGEVIISSSVDFKDFLIEILK